MKKYNILYASLTMATLNFTVVNSMIEVKKEDKTSRQRITVTSATEVITYKNTDLESIAKAYLNNTFPVILYCTAQNKLSLQEAHASINQMKDDPSVAAALNDPRAKDELLNQLTQNMPVLIPVRYLIDQRPETTVMYLGRASLDNSSGIKILEKEGNRPQYSMVYSSQENDSAFIQEPATEYVITRDFSQQANRAMRSFEDQLRRHEKLVADRRFTGDTFGVTSGWNGGNQLMPTEEKSPANRPK